MSLVYLSNISPFILDFISKIYNIFKFNENRFLQKVMHNFALQITLQTNRLLIDTISFLIISKFPIMNF